MVSKRKQKIIFVLLCNLTPSGEEHGDVPARDLSFGDGIEADALDVSLFASSTSWQPLVAAIFAQSAAIAGRDIAE